MLNYFIVNVILFLCLWLVSYLFAKHEMKTGRQASEDKLAFLGLGWILWGVSCFIWLLMLSFN